MNYIPQPNSLGADLFRLFIAQPDLEEVTIPEIVSRFKIDQNGVTARLNTPVSHRVFERVRRDDGALVFRRGRAFDATIAAARPGAITPATAERRTALGAQLRTVDQQIEQQQTEATPPPSTAVVTAPPPAPVYAAAPAPAPAPARGPRRGQPRAPRLPEIDLASVRLVRAPMPTARPPIEAKYDKLFDALIPDHRYELDIAYRSALCKAASTYSKRKPDRKVLVRVLSSTQCAIGLAPAAKGGAK